MARSKGKGGLDLRPLMEEVGLEKYLEVVEVGAYIDTFGPKKVAKALGIDRYLASLNAEERKQLKERLK
jgi:hypothetical protein